MTMPVRYEAPAIVERTRVDLPLVLNVASGQQPSAVFRAEAEYEAPAIVERTPVEMPLIGIGSNPTSAMFRPEAEYEAPAIVERTPVDVDDWFVLWALRDEMTWVLVIAVQPFSG